MLFHHQTIVDSTLLTKLRSSTNTVDTHKGPRMYTAVWKPPEMEDIINKRFKLLILNILGNLAKIKVFSSKYRFL